MPENHPRYVLYGELGRYPLSINIKAKMINSWNKSIASHRHKISKQVYNYVYKWLMANNHIYFLNNDM